MQKPSPEKLNLDYLRAYLKDPLVWYETERGNQLGCLVLFGSTFLLIAACEITQDLQPYLVAAVTTAFIYIVSSLLDKITTEQALEFAEEIGAADYGIKIVETSPVIAKLMAEGKLSTIDRRDYFILVISATVPPFGLTVALLKIIAALNNQKIKVRLRQVHNSRLKDE